MQACTHVHTYIHTHAHSHKLTSMCGHTHTHIHTHLKTNMSVHMCAHAKAFLITCKGWHDMVACTWNRASRVWTHTNVNGAVGIRLVCVCVCVYIYIYIYILLSVPHLRNDLSAKVNASMVIRYSMSLRVKGLSNVLTKW